jgi:hypothetical protein
MEFNDDSPERITTPELWISPYAYESFLMVDAACDRWLKQRAQLRRRASEHAIHELHAVRPLGDDRHSDPRE